MISVCISQSAHTHSTHRKEARENENNNRITAAMRLCLIVKRFWIKINWKQLERKSKWETDRRRRRRDRDRDIYYSLYVVVPFWCSFNIQRSNRKTKMSETFNDDNGCGAIESSIKTKTIESIRKRLTNRAQPTHQADEMKCKRARQSSSSSSRRTKMKTYVQKYWKLRTTVLLYLWFVVHVCL